MELVQSWTSNVHESNSLVLDMGDPTHDTAGSFGPGPHLGLRHGSRRTDAAPRHRRRTRRLNAGVLGGQRSEANRAHGSPTCRGIGSELPVVMIRLVVDGVVVESAGQVGTPTSRGNRLKRIKRIFFAKFS